jgi:hypothetical protein
LWYNIKGAIMIDINKKLKSEKVLTKNLIQRIYDYIGLDVTILEIDYMNKKFTIERKFPNTMLGRDELKETIIAFNSEEKVKKHLGL